MFKKTANEWENVYLKKYGMYYSRIIASWTNVGGNVKSKMFKEWLKSIKDDDTGERVLTDEQVYDIYRLANNGKLEWQENARKFMEEHK